MALKISIDKNSSTPAYRQIIQQVTSMVYNGKLKPGDRLPTERELAVELGIARGTIKKAYDALSRDKIIETTQGRGSFVSSRQDVLPAGRKERAFKLVETMIDELKEMKFSYQEIRTIVDLKIIEKENRLANFNVAVVDCNPESLAIFERQLCFLSQVNVTRFLLDDIERVPEPEKKMSQFDLILTTSTHYSELIGRLPRLREKIVKVAVSPSQETVIAMAGLNPSQRIGVICESSQFLEKVVSRLKNLELVKETVPNLFLCDEHNLPSFLSSVDVIFVPPSYLPHRKREHVAFVQEFIERGGKIIAFDYQIERGSLLHVEERISRMLNA